MVRGALSEPSSFAEATPCQQTVRRIRHHSRGNNAGPVKRIGIVSGGNIDLERLCSRVAA
jgi:hypothetical protein